MARQIEDGTMGADPGDDTSPSRRDRLSAGWKAMTVQRVQPMIERVATVIAVLFGAYQGIKGTYDEVQGRVVPFIFEEHVLMTGWVIRLIGEESLAIVVTLTIVAVSFLLILRAGIVGTVTSALQGLTPGRPAVDPSTDSSIE